MNSRLVYQGDWTFAVRKDFVLNPGISTQAKVLYLAIRSYCAPDGTAYPSGDTLAAALGVSRNTVSKYREELERLGLLKCEQQHSEAGKFSHNVFTLFDSQASNLPSKDGATDRCPNLPQRSFTAAVDLRAKINPSRTELVPKRAIGPSLPGFELPEPEPTGQPTGLDAPEVKCWNSQEKLQKVKAMTGSRIEHLKARRSDKFWVDNFSAGIFRVARSHFCTGKNDRGWRASFDWLLRPDTLVRVMEGRYDNKKEDGIGI